MKLYPRNIIIDEDKDEYELNIKNSSNDEKLLLFKIRRSEEKLVSFTPKSGIVSTGTTIKIILKVYNRNIMKSRLLVKLNVLKKSLYIENDFEQSWNIACTRATEIKKVVDISNASIIGLQSIISKSTITNNGSSSRIPNDNFRSKRLLANPILRRPSNAAADTTDIQSVTSSVSMQVSIISDAYQSTSSSPSNSSNHEENDQTTCKSSLVARMMEGSVIEFNTYSIVTSTKQPVTDNHQHHLLQQGDKDHQILIIDNTPQLEQQQQKLYSTTTTSLSKIINEHRSIINSIPSIGNTSIINDPSAIENYFQDNDFILNDNINKENTQLVAVDNIIAAHSDDDSINNIVNHNTINKDFEEEDTVVGSTEELLLKTILELTQNTPHALQILNKILNINNNNKSANNIINNENNNNYVSNINNNNYNSNNIDSNFNICNNNTTLINLAFSSFNEKDTLFILSDNREDKENISLHSSCMLELTGSNVCNDNFAYIAEKRVEQAMISKCKVIAITVKDTSITELKTSISLLFFQKHISTTTNNVIDNDDENNNNYQGDNQSKLLVMHANLINDNLKHLSINHSLLINIDASINRFYNLTTLNVSSNKIHTILGPIILPQLKSLDISNNQLTSFDFLESLLSLHTLQAANNCLSSLQSSVNMLILLTNLSTLDLSLNPVADHYNYVSEVLDILPNIKYFDSCDIEALCGKSYQNSHYHTLSTSSNNKHVHQSNKTNKQDISRNNLPCLPIDIKNQSIVHNNTLAGSISLKDKKDNFERRLKKYMTKKQQHLSRYHHRNSYSNNNNTHSINITSSSNNNTHSPSVITSPSSGWKQYHHHTKFNNSYSFIHHNNNNSMMMMKGDELNGTVEVNDDNDISAINKEINNIENSLYKPSSSHSDKNNNNIIATKDTNSISSRSNNNEVKSLNTQESYRSNRYNRSSTPTEEDNNEDNPLTNDEQQQKQHHHDLNRSKDDEYIYNYHSQKKLTKESNKQKANKTSLFADTESFKRRKEVNLTNHTTTNNTNKSNRSNDYHSESDIISKPSQLSARKIAHTISFIPDIFKEMQYEDSKYNTWHSRYRIPKPIFGFSVPFIHKKQPTTTTTKDNQYYNSNNDVSFTNIVKRLRDGFQKVQPCGTFAREKKHLPVDFYPMDHAEVAFFRRKGKFSDPIGVQLCCKDNNNEESNKSHSINPGMLSISGSVIISPDRPGRKITYVGHQSRYNNSILNKSNDDGDIIHREDMYGYKKWHQELFSKDNDNKLSNSFDKQHHRIISEEKSIESNVKAIDNNQPIENRNSYNHNDSLLRLANRPIEIHTISSSNNNNTITQYKLPLALPNRTNSSDLSKEISPTPPLKPKEIMQLVTKSYEDSHKAITSSIELSNKKITTVQHLLLNEYNPFYQDNSPPYDHNYTLSDRRFHSTASNDNNKISYNNSNNNNDDNNISINSINHNDSSNNNNDNSFYQYGSPPHNNDSCIVEMASPEDINLSKSDNSNNNDINNDDFVFKVILPTDDDNDIIENENNVVDNINNEDDDVAEEEVALSMYLSWLNSHQINNYDNLISSSVNKSMNQDDEHDYMSNHNNNRNSSNNSYNSDNNSNSDNSITNNIYSVDHIISIERRRYCIEIKEEEVGLGLLPHPRELAMRDSISEPTLLDDEHSSSNPLRKLFHTPPKK